MTEQVPTTPASCPRPRLLRCKTILAEYVPVSRSAWYQGIAKGIYPAPIQLSERSVAWRESDILDLLERLASQNR